MANTTKDVTTSQEEVDVPPAERVRIHDAITTRRTVVTPAIAEAFLLNMGRNRPKKQNAIAVYAADMSADRWADTGEPMIFDWFGQMRDGQQRCYAIIKSGVSLPMVIVEGVDPTSVTAMDIGVSRGLSDILSFMSTGAVGLRASAIASRMYRWDVQNQYMSSLGRSISKQAVLDYFLSHEHEIQSANAFGDNGYIRNLMVPSVYGTIRILLRRVDFGAAEDFLTQLVTGEIEDIDGIGHNIQILRHRLTTDRFQLKQARARQGKGIATYPMQEVQRMLVFVMWNHWRAGNRQDRVVSPKDIVNNYPHPR